MQSLSNITTRAQGYIDRVEHWKHIRYISHGLGMLEENEHAEMVKFGIIQCENGVDSVIADYPKLMIKKSDEMVSIDMGGNLRDINFEKERLQKEGKIASIEFFPKKFVDYMDNKRLMEKRRFAQREVSDSLETEEMRKIEAMFNP